MNIDIKKTQKRLLHMAKEVSAILDRNGIPHSIVYGTLLGAVRHKGFVPWDDDFDFCVFEELYDDAMKCLGEELPDDLFLENEKTEPLYFHAWAHVKDLKSDTRSVLYAQDNVYAHHGLSIDLYRLKKVRLSEVLSECEKQIYAYVDRRRSKGLISEEEVDRQLQRIKWREGWIEARFPNETEESMQREVYANVYTSPYSTEIIDFFPLKEYEFEDTKFWGPNNADKILRHWYGDYMILPPEKKRNSHFEYVKFLDD